MADFNANTFDDHIISKKKTQKRPTVSQDCTTNGQS